MSESKRDESSTPESGGADDDLAMMRHGAPNDTELDDAACELAEEATPLFRFLKAVRARSYRAGVASVASPPPASPDVVIAGEQSNELADEYGRGLAAIRARADGATPFGPQRFPVRLNGAGEVVLFDPGPHDMEEGVDFDYVPARLLDAANARIAELEAERAPVAKERCTCDERGGPPCRAHDAPVPGRVEGAHPETHAPDRVTLAVSGRRVVALVNEGDLPSGRGAVVTYVPESALDAARAELDAVRTALRISGDEPVGAVALVMWNRFIEEATALKGARADAARLETELAEALAPLERQTNEYTTEAERNAFDVGVHHGERESRRAKRELKVRDAELAEAKAEALDFSMLFGDAIGELDEAWRWVEYGRAELKVFLDQREHVEAALNKGYWDGEKLTEARAEVDMHRVLLAEAQQIAAQHVGVGEALMAEVERLKAEVETWRKLSGEQEAAIREMAPKLEAAENEIERLKARVELEREAVEWRDREIERLKEGGGQ